MSDQPRTKVNLADIEAAIVNKTFTRMPSGKTLICELTLKNGFTVRGEASVVSLENYVQERGEEYACAAAIDNCWPLFGFLLQESLYQSAGGQPTTPAGMVNYTYSAPSVEVPDGVEVRTNNAGTLDVVKAVNGFRDLITKTRPEDMTEFLQNILVTCAITLRLVMGEEFAVKFLESGIATLEDDEEVERFAKTLHISTVRIEPGQVQ